MDREDVVALIDEIRRLGSELEDVETKAAQGGLPERIYRSLSALSNRRGGGVILFGVNVQMTNADYRRLHHGVVETVEATRELGELVEAGLVEMHGTRRWAYYTLSEEVLPRVQPILPLAMSDEDRILAYVQEHGSITSKECRELLGWTESDRYRAKRLLLRLVREGKLRLAGKGRWTRYERL